jgi:trans-4-hydroxy-L-proline dehydratase
VLFRSEAPEATWELAANYVLGGLGFPVVNDEVLIPAMLRHGRTLGDARDYICSCCYEHTIPGREAFHPNGAYLNLPFVLELALNEGRSLRTGDLLGRATPPASTFRTLDDLLDAFRQQLHYVLAALARQLNGADAAHCRWRRYPLMSLFIDDCLARGQDVCAGGARYNLTGCIVAGLPNTVNALAAIRLRIYQQQRASPTELLAALRADYAGYEALRQELLAAPKWGNDLPAVDDLAATVSEALYAEISAQRNPRGGRWQMALYSFVANTSLGTVVGATADGRRSGEMLTRNLNPTWGSDRLGPTAVLRSLSHIDFTQAPDGSSLDLRFDPAPFQSADGRAAFVAFLKAFVQLGVMEMQLSFVDTETLRDAQRRPEHYPHLMVRVAGYSARFVDLPAHEQAEIIGRTAQRGA